MDRPGDPVKVGDHLRGLIAAGDAKPVSPNPVGASKQQDFVVKPDPATQPAAPIGGQTGFWAALARVLAAIFGKGKQQ